MYKAPTNGSYTVNACCPKCGTVMSAQISAPETSYVKFLENQNARLREALQRIEQNEMCEYGCDCGSSADQIARDALEGRE